MTQDKDSSNRVVNTFESGMNLNLSDMVMPSKIGRFMQNTRMINLQGSSFVISNLLGNQVRFQLTTGFSPVATQEFNGVLYIVSWCDDPENVNYKKLELGSFPSPNYALPSSSDIYVYRPFNNLDGGPFRTIAYGIDTLPIVQKLEVQNDYDQSVNLCFTIVGKTPRIVNSKFKVNKIAEALEFIILANRASAANSNTYTAGTVDKETSTILYSDKLLKIAFGGVTSGGKLKPGNYSYVFQYMTEDFNKTGVIGQSLICQVANGNSINTLQGGDETQETSKRVILNLTNVDIDFTFFKVYVLYSAGQDLLFQQTLEFTQPISITGSTMTFTHTGFEELAAVSSETVNVDYALISAAYASTQIGGFYLLGGITQRSYDFQQFKIAAQAITPTFKVKDLPTGVLQGYADPDNVYNNLGYMGHESYPWGIVFVLPGNQLSPVFPTAGKIFQSAIDADEPAITPLDQKDGIVTFPPSSQYRCYKSGKVRVKYLQLDFTSMDPAIKTKSLGFFFVRGERRPWMITQGMMVPTMCVPPVEYTDYRSGGVYEQVHTDGTDTNFYRNIPIVDNVIEAFELDGNQSSDDTYVMNEFMQENVNTGRMPTYINDLRAMNVNFLDNMPLNRWAVISGEALLNEPAYVSLLRRPNSYIRQLAKMNCNVEDAPPLQYTATGWAGTDGTLRTGIHFNMNSLNNTGYTDPALSLFKLTKYIDYVIAETFATGSNFISKIIHRFYTFGATHRYAYGIRQVFNSFFGVEMQDALIDSSRSAANPIAGNARIGSGLYTNPGSSELTDIPISSGPRYSNFGTNVPAGFLVNVYPDNLLPYELISGVYVNKLYPTIDTVVYKQCSPWYAWGDLPVVGPDTNRVDVYGGDCFISRISRKLSQSGFRNPAVGTDLANMPLGTILTWYQESKYNLWLRQPKQFDLTETEKRTFYPFRNNGDALQYQNYRYPETLVHAQGYARTLAPKSFFAPPSLAPFIENEFFSRVYHSERHIPNAFKNGYRAFLQTSFQDYDSSMGRIIALFNHRGKLVIVFQHGLGITDIEQRVPIGGDNAGEVFIRPDTILPRTIQYISREIGCQDTLSLVQTPSSLYGVDKAKSVIWQFSEKLKVISDNTVSSFIINNIVAPRAGYDLLYSEVLFTTNAWTLCFREGLEAFTSFYSFKPYFYARRNNELYSFIGKTAWMHNAPVYTIYGESKDVIVEIVVNSGLGGAKTLDFLNVISNEVPPIKVEFYTYNQDVDIGEVIQVAHLNQYAKIDNVFDTVDDQFPIKYRDKKFVMKSPYRSAYGAGSVDDDWGIGGRVRDKYIIVRLTYNTIAPLELASVISSFRYSRS